MDDVQGKNREKKWIGVVLVVVGILAILAAVLFNGYKQGQCRTQDDIDFTEEFITDIPEPTVLVSAQSQSEIRFQDKEVTFDIIGIGTDSKGQPCIVADVINDSNSLAELSLSSDAIINGYPVDAECYVVAEPSETLRTKIIIEPAFIAAMRLNADNINTLSFEVRMDYGMWRKSYEYIEDVNTITFDSPESYNREKEEAITKDSGDLCYSDENIDVYYQGVVEYPYDIPVTHVVLFVEAKNSTVYSMRDTDTSSTPEIRSYGGYLHFMDSDITGYLDVYMGINGELPNSCTCNFEYDFSDSSETTSQSKEISLTMDLTKKIVGNDNAQ